MHICKVSATQCGRSFPFARGDPSEAWKAISKPRPALARA
jgi:hypothetical protein